MRTLKIIPALVMILTMVFPSCQKDEKSKVEPETPITQNQFIKENVSFVDARMRSISVNNYVRELVLNNHSAIKMMPSSLIFQDTYFVDDGSSNDLKSNDGVYTSTDMFEYSVNVKYDKHNPTVSIMKEVIFDKTFKYKIKLKAFVFLK